MNTPNTAELARLQELQSYDILDTAAEDNFDCLTRLAASICETPIALVTLVDENRQWFKSKIGMAVDETDRTIAFCAHAIMDRMPFIVPDTLANPLFANNPMVLDAPHLRFYAGVPLISPQGHALGTLCVKDVVPRTLNDMQLQALQTIAEQVMVQLELRRDRKKFEQLALERQRVQDHLKLLEASISCLNDMVVITEAGSTQDADPRIVFVNQAFTQRTGYSPEEAVGQTPLQLQGPNTQPEQTARIHAAMQRGESIRAEFISSARNGEEFWVEAEIVPVTDNAGRRTHWVWVEREVTQRKLAEQEINHLAYYDQLTQLPNRRLLLDRLQQAQASNMRSKSHGALLFIDLDNFKTINDTLGHAKGDQLLKQVAQRLIASTRATETVARIGGDEFVVMLTHLSENVGEAATAAKILGERILADFVEPFHIGSYEHRSTPSIGITLFSNDDDTLEELLKRADFAMYQAKAAGRNTLRFFNSAMQNAVSARLTLEEDLRQALHSKEFSLCYQVQVQSDGRPLGAEVLVRWQHPQKGLIAPADFIPLAEESGLIMPLGLWVLEQACMQLAAWADDPQLSQLSLSVNVSVQQYHHPDFAQQVLKVLNRTGASPQKLNLELTESVFVDDLEDIIDKMASLKLEGICFSLDDFGTGYSSLSYLKRLPFDRLKIDQSFVKDLFTDANDAAIVRTIIALGQTLGLSVIAEGVETEEQRDFLARHGCHAYQGYLFSRPMPVAEFEQFVRAASNK